jgi:hypothetical protein
MYTPGVSSEISADRLIATVDAHGLHSIRWIVMRDLFPRFAEQLELRRFVRDLMRTDGSSAVRIQPHRADDGSVSDHVFDVYEMAR